MERGDGGTGTRAGGLPPSGPAVAPAAASEEAPVEVADTREEQEWYRDAVIYQVHVRAFQDSDGDGIGDFRGLTSRLDYLQDLGVTALWVLPFYPSPLRDDGYDIADYRDVHPDYGTLADFELFLREAHRRGLRVITELVLNHTSDQHEWFQRARRDEPGGEWRDFYVWGDDPGRYGDARIIFQDFESSNWTWDPQAGAYYWHRFYHHQPDLNFENPRVQEAMLDVVDFWLEKGVDGLRLDAVPYLYEEEGTSCENLPETHAFLKRLRCHVDESFPGRMLLAEANQWPEDAVAYFGDGDECHMCFHFPVMPRLFMAVRMEDRFPIVDILEQTPPLPGGAQWALFLRNHDELTLEMVTDEERDYMYRVYATDPRARINLGIRRRLAPLLDNNRKKIELMYGLLFSLPGSPIIYYGDEIGMGDNIFLGDRNGVRTPMQWSGDRNAGFSRANPQRLYLPVITDPEFRYEAVNVAAQQDNPSSLYWWVKRLVGIRKRHPAFSRGELEFVPSDNPRVLAFVRRAGEETLLVVANLARFSQHARLDLSAYSGAMPLELFGHTEFPRVGEGGYALSLGPHAFYWFRLRSDPAPSYRQRVLAPEGGEPVPPEIRALSAQELFTGEARGRLEEALAEFLPSRRWFAGGGREVRRVRIDEAIPVPEGEADAYLCLLDVAFREGPPERYAAPLRVVRGEVAPHPGGTEIPDVAVVRLTGEGERVRVRDAVESAAFCRALLELVGEGGSVEGRAGRLEGRRGPGYGALHPEEGFPPPRTSRAEQSNSSVIFGEAAILKLYRRLEEGTHPDLEIGRYLTERGFPHTPPLAGELRYRRDRRGYTAVGTLHGYVENEGDGWAFTQNALSRYLERALASRVDPGPDAARPCLGTGRVLEAAPASERMVELLGTYPEAARKIGRRTAELHGELADARGNPEFAPRGYTALDRRSLYQSFRNLVGRTFRDLEGRRATLPEPVAVRVDEILPLRESLLRRARALVECPLTSPRIRCHGDYHLGQLLYTGRDFVIVDFEGEPRRSLAARRARRSALVDVAGMLRSFHYAAHAAGMAAREQGLADGGEGSVDGWTRVWCLHTSAAFLDAYLEAADGGRFLPEDREELRYLLDLFQLEKAVYELGYELDHRPPWTAIPVQGVLELAEELLPA